MQLLSTALMVCISHTTNTTNITLIDSCTGTEANSTAQLAMYVVGVLAMFAGLAIVCDEYFVPSLELMGDSWKLAPNVAGATLMAAGGSAPELFTSFVGTFQRSVVGFSTVVGSAVFNVLFVIGTCIMLQKKPQKLSSWPLVRDCSYYTFALVSLSIFFSFSSPNVIEWWEALILFAEYIIYVFMMKHNDTVHQFAIKHGIVREELDVESNNVTFRAGVIKLLLDSKNFVEGVSIRVVTEIEGNVDQTFDSIDTDGNGHIDQQELDALVKTLGFDTEQSNTQDLFTSIDTDGNGKISKDEFRQWYLGSEQRIVHDSHRVFEEIAGHNDTVSQRDMKHILKRLDSGKHDTLMVAGSDKTLEYALGIEESGGVTYDQFLQWYKTTMLWQQNIEKAQEEATTCDGVDISFPKEGLFNKIMWVLTIPLLLAFYLTIPDVRKRGWHNWKYATFGISICWIGVLSYWMVIWAEIIGNTIGIPVNVMGLTVLAAGTSVPDLISSVIVMRQNEGDMAISSSIGSNIFDVLVGLPVPWLVFSLYHNEQVEVVADNLAISLPILTGMLFAVVVSIHCSNWVTQRPLGYAMFILYGLFVAQDLIRSDWDC